MMGTPLPGTPSRGVKARIAALQSAGLRDETAKGASVSHPTWSPPLTAS